MVHNCILSITDTYHLMQFNVDAIFINQYNLYAITHQQQL